MIRSIKTKKMLLYSLVFLLLLSAAAQAFCIQSARADTTYIKYSNSTFPDTSDPLLNLMGTAAIHDNALYLTDDTQLSAGSAFLNEKSSTSSGFSTFFKFELTNRIYGADGMVFVVADANDQCGYEGALLGYYGIGNSIGIEFDTLRSSNDAWENSNSHIAIDTNGYISSEPLAYTMLPDDYFNADGPFFVWIDYDALNEIIEVRLATDASRPADATLSASVDISTYTGAEYYPGFTASTGVLTEDHKILQWDFNGSYISDGLNTDGTGTYDMDNTAPTAPTLKQNGGEVKLSGSADSGSGLMGYEYKIEDQEWNQGDTADISGVGEGAHTVYGRATDNAGNISEETSYEFESGPVMAVKGNGQHIANGDTTPITEDHTDFGTTSDADIERTFVINNTGNYTLTLGSSPVSLGRTGDFQISSQPAASIAAGGSSSFTVRYAPSTAGTSSDTVTIASDDDNSSYTFSISGTYVDDPETGEVDDPETGEVDDPETGEIENPKIGDSSNEMILIVLVSSAAAALIILAVIIRKKQKDI